MATVQFPYFSGFPTISLTLWDRESGRGVVRRLLVDSGFTGQSELVLSAMDCRDFRRRAARAGRVTGALQGVHQRVVVTGSLPELKFQRRLLALAADVDRLALPIGIDGLVGLTFLNRFTGWGARQSAAGQWSFFVES